MTNFFVFMHFYFTTYKLCIKAHSDENLQSHSLQALENTRKTGKNYTILTPKRYKSYCRRQKIEKLCTIYAENTQDNHDILYKNSYTLLFPLPRRLRSEFEPRRTHHNRGIRISQRKRNRVFGFFFFCAVFVFAPVIVAVAVGLGKNKFKSSSFFFPLFRLKITFIL